MKYAIDITDTAKGHLWDIAIYIAIFDRKSKKRGDVFYLDTSPYR